MAVISIIVPVYNVEKYLSRCLDSLLAQTFSDLEIICVNDGSADRSGEILADYEKRDPRIKRIDQENRGNGEARNRGLREVTSPFLMFCDSDDWYEPDMCQIMHDTIQRENVDFACCGVFIDSEERDVPKLIGNISGIPEGKYTNFEKIFLGLNGAVWNKIFKTDIVKKYNVSFAVNVIDDYIFCREYMLVCRSLFYFRKRLYHYIMRNGSVVDKWLKKNEGDQCDFEQVRVYKHIYDFILKNNLWEKHRDLFVFNYIGFLCRFWAGIPRNKRTRFLETVREFVITVPDPDWGNKKNRKLMAAIREEKYEIASRRMTLWIFTTFKLWRIYLWLLGYRMIFEKFAR